MASPTPSPARAPGCAGPQRHHRHRVQPAPRADLERQRAARLLLYAAPTAPPTPTRCTTTRPPQRGRHDRRLPARQTWTSAAKSTPPSWCSNHRASADLHLRASLYRWKIDDLINLVADADGVGQYQPSAASRAAARSCPPTTPAQRRAPARQPVLPARHRRGGRERGELAARARPDELSTPLAEPATAHGVSSPA